MHVNPQAAFMRRQVRVTFGQFLEKALPTD